MKKFFELKEVKYLWLLVLSMAAFVAALFLNAAYPETFTKVEVPVYGAVLLIAFLWSILNYLGQLQLHTIYRRFDNIDNFIKCLPMNEEEKKELNEYLNDFVKDMVESGKSHEEAVRTAISQFLVKEIAERDGDLLETKPHYYLLGYTAIFVIIVAVIQGINTIVHLPFLFLAVSFMLIAFSFGFISLFILYKLLNMVLAKK